MRVLKGFFIDPFVDLFRGLEAQLPPQRNLLVCAAIILVSMACSWFVYVPIHELLHAWGCLLAGGEVTELQIQPMYGGRLLARVFDFVTPGGPYAGRLSGFDDHGSDLIYLVTVFMPFTLSILGGVTLLRRCGRRHRPAVYGLAVVLGLAPLYNLQGDYYEMGSILVTRAAGGRLEPGQRAALRSDDVFKLIDTIRSAPETLGIGMDLSQATAWTLVTCSAILAVLLALATYQAGVGVDALSRRVWPGTGLENPQEAATDDTTPSDS